MRTCSHVRAPQPGPRSIQKLAHGAGIVEQFSLQLCRQGIPLHDQCGTEAPQDELFFVRERRADWSLLFRVQSVLIIVCKPLLIIREHSKSLFQLSKSTPLFQTARFIGQIAVFTCFRTILRGFKHRVPCFGC
jgi:hypothetical protein